MSLAHFLILLILPLLSFTTLVATPTSNLNISHLLHHHLSISTPSVSRTLFLVSPIQVLSILHSNLSHHHLNHNPITSLITPPLQSLDTAVDYQFALNTINSTLNGPAFRRSSSAPVATPRISFITSIWTMRTTAFLIANSAGPYTRQRCGCSSC